MSAPAGAARQRGGSVLWVQGLVCGGLVALRPGVALLAALLLWPVAVAAFADRVPGRPLARTVALFSAAAALPTLQAAWGSSDSGALSGALFAALGDGGPLWLAWAAAGTGWGLAQLAPAATDTAMRAARKYRAARLRAERAALLKAWRLRADDGPA